MKRQNLLTLLSSVIIVFLVSFSNGLYSQGQKYAFVDTEYILDNIPEFQDAQDELDDLSVKWQKEIEAKYASEIKPLKEKLDLRGKEAPSAAEKKKLRKQLKELQEKIESEIKAQIKKEFDYEIPIAEVEKAGISSTGAEIENELIPLAEEYKKYRKKKPLWQKKSVKVKYEELENDTLYRISVIEGIAHEPEIFYGK
jgi:type I restriction enzyme M protein